MAQPVLAGELGGALEERLVDVLVDVDPLDAAAGLAGVEESAVDQVLDGVRQVGVGPDIGGIAAAELQPGADEAIGGGSLHGAAAVDRAGEGDEVDARILDDLRGVVMAEMEELEQALRQAAAAQRFEEALGAERRL